MQGLVSFASQIGLAFAIVIQPICYLGALFLFLKGGWGLWRMAQPDNPHRGRPWVPFVSILIAGVLGLLRPHPDQGQRERGLHRRGQDD